MQYDPVKRQLGNVFNRSPFLRKVFYNLLDLLPAAIETYNLLSEKWFTHATDRKSVV